MGDILFKTDDWVFSYRGRKVSHSKWLQWAFYLFYPVHLLVLALAERWIFG